MGPLILILTTFIWGTAFLAQKVGADTLGPVALTVYRNILGAAFLFGIVAIRGQRGKVRQSIIAGIACGVPLFAAMTAQQIGIEYTTPGISAFLTTNYVLFVPLIVAIITKTRPGLPIIVGVALAMIGTYLICMTGETMSIGKGEAWTILCALLFSVQMILVDHYAPKCDILMMSAVQLATCAIIGAPLLALPSEAGRIIPTTASIWPIVYCGVLSSGIAYTLQNIGQAKTPAALAAILLSLESVFGALSGYVVRGDIMTSGQFFGCALVFIAAASSQALTVIYQQKHKSK